MTPPVSHKLNTTNIESDNLQISYDSILSECPLAHDISTPDISGLFNPFADCFIPGTRDYFNEYDPPVSHELHTKDIENDNLQISYDSILSGCHFAHDISTPDISGLLDPYGNSMLDVSPSVHNVSTPDLSHFSDTGGNNTNTASISKFSELSFLDSSKNNIIDENKTENSDPFNTLKSIRLSNIHRLIIGHLNINSLRNKFEALKYIVSGNLDILIVTESKLDESFPDDQFCMEGYSPPFRADRDAIGGGVIIYVRNDIPCRKVIDHPPTRNLEGIFLELNLRKTKWLLFGGYNPTKGNILNLLGPVLDHYMIKYDNFLILGDFNSEMSENAMKEFSDTYNLKNLIKEPTCFKNPLNPSLIDLILTK